jgi:hypothetical protein
MADSLLSEDLSEREALVNKWKDKTPQEVLDAKVESDLYIKTLTARLDDLKKDYLDIREKQQASEDLKSLIDQMKKGQQSEGTVQKPENTIQTPAIKPEDIESLVSKKLTEHQLVIKQQENFNIVQGKLKETLGDNYQSIYKQKLDSLGLTKEFADDLAKNHPSVFIKTFELETKPMSNQAPLPRNAQRPAGFAPNTQKRDWNYYQELKKTNPKLYLDPKIANQMHDDAIALGSDFGMPD